ncbi:MAG: phytoene desaturase family protein [Pyrinomonadaceae bacterium]
MIYEVVVVGGGVGGLTAAALLAARGVSVCLLEKQSYVGGCLATVEHGSRKFEPTHGLYSGWEAGGIYERLFAALRTSGPHAHPERNAYVVRLPDGIEVPRTTQIEDFETYLGSAFPECATAAIGFYRSLANFTERETEPEPIVAAHLRRCSPRFQRFVDVQLQTLGQCSSDECSYEFVASALNPERRFWSIEGGAQTLVDTLAASFKQSGGTLRLNSNALRLAYGTNDLPMGVDLLSGERVIATRAIVSNLTIWDTYGKLIGPARTPRNVSSALKSLRGWGVYQLFLTMNKSVARSLRSRPILALTDWQKDLSYDPEGAQLVFSAGSPASNDTAEGLAAVVSVYTNTEGWFSFHEDHAAHEERDQSMLKRVWSQMHRAIPELGDGIELIETATPQTYYEGTRRRFGMIGRVTSPPGFTDATYGATPYENVFIVSDTASAGLGLEGVIQSATKAANQICPNLTGDERSV